MPRGVKRERKDPAARPAIARGIPEKVVDAILDTFGVDEEEITTDSTLMDDLRGDSLDVVELQIALEEAYGLESGRFDDAVSEVWESGTVGDVIRSLRSAGVRV